MKFAALTVAAVILGGCAPAAIIPPTPTIEGDGTIDYGTGYYNDVATESGIGCADLSLAREGGGKGCRQVQKGDGVSVLGTTRDRAFVKVTYFARWNTLWVPANILTLRPR